MSFQHAFKRQNVVCASSSTPVGDGPISTPNPKLNLASVEENGVRQCIFITMSLLDVYNLLHRDVLGLLGYVDLDFVQRKRNSGELLRVLLLNGVAHSLSLVDVNWKSSVATAEYSCIFGVRGSNCAYHLPL